MLTHNSKVCWNCSCLSPELDHLRSTCIKNTLSPASAQIASTAKVSMQGLQHLAPSAHAGGSQPPTTANTSTLAFPGSRTVFVIYYLLSRGAGLWREGLTPKFRLCQPRHCPRAPISSDQNKGQIPFYYVLSNIKYNSIWEEQLVNDTYHTSITIYSYLAIAFEVFINH